MRQSPEELEGGPDTRSGQLPRLGLASGLGLQVPWSLRLILQCTEVKASVARGGT